MITCSSDSQMGGISNYALMIIALTLSQHVTYSEGTTWSVTSAHYVWQVFVDGVRKLDIPPNRDDWNTPDSFSVPDDAWVVSVGFREQDIWADPQVPYGMFLASTDTGLISNKHWRCSHDATRWTDPKYDDSHWPHAVEYAQNGGDPFNSLVPGISPDAYWIGINVSVAALTLSFCRLTRSPQWTMTAAHAIHEAYVDGVLHSFSPTEQHVWQQPSTLVYTHDTRDLAVRLWLPDNSPAPDMTYAAFLASSNTGVTSNSSWRCTNTLYEGWNNAGYNDAHWPHATEIAANGGYPFNSTVSDISLAALWIGTGQDAGVNNYVYCRQTRTCDDGDNSMTWTVTSDDIITEIYINGTARHACRTTSRWLISNDYRNTFTPGTQVVAIRMNKVSSSELSSTPRLLASSSHGAVTNSIWRCTRSSYANWYTPGYDDSDWRPAIEYGPNRGVISQIHPDAQWIGSGYFSSETVETFCRLSHVFCSEVVENCVVLECLGCQRCDYDWGPGLQAFEVASDGQSCLMLCSWRPDSRHCYPGTCHFVEDCQCAEGFEGENCMTITEPTDISSCGISLESVHNQEWESFTNVCFEDKDNVAPSFSRHEVLHLNVSFEASFPSPDNAIYPVPDYIDTFAVGVISAKIKFDLQRGGSTIHSGELICAGPHSPSAPNTDVLHCYINFLLGHLILHEDSLEFEYEVENGGHVSLFDFDNGQPDPGQTHYYDGSTTTHYSTVIFDFERPEHCYPGCNDNWLDVGDHYTRNGTLDITWSGWFDDVAGVNEYVISVFKMEPYGEELGYDINDPYATYVGTEERAVIELNTGDTGMFCVVLDTRDAAGNHVVARRFVLYDNTSYVTMADRPAETGATGPEYRWVSSLQNEISAVWEDHFMNTVHMEMQMLNAIGDHDPQSDVLLEDATGEPPLVRSREEILNTNGIVRHVVVIEPTQEQCFQETKRNDHQKRKKALPDNTFCVFVEAFDVMNNTASDYLLVAMDASPPNIKIKSSVINDIKEMSIEIDCYDEHSGVKAVTWEIKSGQGKVETGTIQPKIVSPQCEDASCYCTPLGPCYPRHFSINASLGDLGNDLVSVKVTATNYAMLQASDSTYTSH